MEVTSTTKYVHLSPKKARDVVREIQGLPVSAALEILTFTPKKAAFLISKTLSTAIADAENNFSLDTSTLVIKEAVIGAGPTQRRFRPRAKGAAGPILRRTSHISITVAGAPPEKKRQPVSARRKTEPKAITEAIETPEAIEATNAPESAEVVQTAVESTTDSSQESV